MTESDESSDYGFISKYIRDDNDNGKSNDEEIKSFKDRFTMRQSGTVEVFGSVGEGESFSNNFNNSSNFNGKRFHKKEEDFDEDENNEESSKTSEAKKEFLKKIKEDSLSLDTCEKVGRDWNRN